MADNIPSTDAGKAREGLIDELETINNYEEMASETSDPKLKAQFEEITDDERVHVGNFAEMVSENDPKAEPMMKEGLKEAKEFGKAYRLYSFQEMMSGASHFEKRRRRETPPQERRIQQAMADRVFRDNLRSDPKYAVRNGEISKDELLHSRIQDMEGLVLGASKLVTPDDMGPEFKRLSMLYGLENPFDYKGQEYITVQGSDDKFYVYAPDDGSILGYKYRQLQMKDVGDGTYVFEFITPKVTEHRTRPIPEPVTPEIALEYYREAQRREQVAGPKDRRDYVTQEFADLREERNPGNPLDKWDVNAYSADRKATGNRIELFNNNDLYQQVEALGYALAKPKKFLSAIQDGTGQEKLEKIGKMVIGSENTSKILSRKGNPDANINALSKEIAKKLSDAKSIGSHTGLLSNLNTVIDELRNEYPQFDETVKTQMDKMKTIARQDNSSMRIDRNYRLNAKDDFMRETARKALAQKIAKRKEIERVYRNQMRPAPSVEAAQGIKRYNRDSFVPRLHGKAFPLSRIQNYEKILPDELAFAAIDASRIMAEARRQRASERKARDEMNAADAIAEKNALLKKFPEYDNYLDEAETQREENMKRILQESQERKDGSRLHISPRDKWPLIRLLTEIPGYERTWREWFNKDYLDEKWLDSLNETYKKEYGFDPDEARDSIEREFFEVPSIMRKKKTGVDEQGKPIYEELGLETPAKAFAREERKKRLNDWESKERPFIEKKRYLDWVNGQFKDFKNPSKQVPKLNPESGLWEYVYEDDGGRARNDFYMSKYGVPFDDASKAQQMKIKKELDAEWPKLVAAQKEKIRQSKPYRRDINARKRKWIEDAFRERYGDQIRDYGKWIHENGDWSEVWGDPDTAYATNMAELDDAYIKNLSEQNGIDAYKDENGGWHYTSTYEIPKDSFYDIKHPSDVVEHNENAEQAMVNATTSKTEMDEEGQADLDQKPSDYTPPINPASEFGQGKKLESLDGVIGDISKKYEWHKIGDDKVEEEKEPTTTTAKSASFEEMLKSANARQWEEKGLPSGSMEATLPAYYRTVTIGSDRDAVNVYEHKKMPVGGDGINVKKVPGIGPKMSKKGDEMEPNEKAEPVRKNAGIREMIARNCFEKTGRIPDVEFMDTYEVKKAANETDFNEMADAYSRKNRQKEIADSSYHEDIFDIENADLYAGAMRGDILTDADMDAIETANRKDLAYLREKASKDAQPYGHRIANTVDAASATSVPMEEKEKYLGNEPEHLVEKVRKEVRVPIGRSSNFQNAIKGIVDSHLSHISNEERAKIAKDLYKAYMDRFNQGLKL